MGDALANAVQRMHLSIKTELMQKRPELLADTAEACSRLFNSTAEALSFIGTPEEAGNGFKQCYQEYWSKKHRRYYYCSTGLPGVPFYNSWEPPKPMQLKDWLLDASLYQLDVVKVKEATLAIRRLLDDNWHRPAEVWECVGLLARIINNVVQCGNTVDKYRHIRTDNAKFREKVVAVPGSADVLRLAGFSQAGDEVVFPEGVGAGAPQLCLATLVGSKLQALADRRGFSGSSTDVDDTADQGGPSKPGCAASTAKWASKPGFRFQEEIWECSLCAHPINDGTERLRTRSHDSPKGQFRYECTTCPQPFNLCEACWDKRMAGDVSGHDASHVFRTVHPRESLHGLGVKSTDANPWGVQMGASIGRARERLKERHGL